MQKRLGVVFIGLGFIGAGAGGLWLAGQVSSGNLLPSTVMLIVPITLLVGVGIYMISGGGREPGGQSSMELQRRMVEVLNSRGQISIDAMAAELGVTSQMVETMLEQLQQLDVFGGEIDWEHRVLYYREREH